MIRLLKNNIHPVLKAPFLFPAKGTISLVSLASFVGALLLLSGCKGKPAALSLPFINKPDFTPEWIEKNDPGYQTIHTIPAFSFTNQNRETITEKTVEGKIYVANFIFTRCNSICPRMTANMATIQEKFKNNNAVLLLSHSVTPEIDSVPVLKRYAAAKGVISGKWHLLTGKQDDIYRMAKKEYYAGDTIGYYQTGNEFLHTENFILVDKYRRIRGVYNGTLPLEADRLIDDINTLLKEE